MRTWVRVVVIIAAVATLSGFSLAVWPTPWRDRVVTMSAGTFTGRQHRLTGEVQVLCVDGWRRLTVDPFADLAYPKQTPAEKADPCLSAPYVNATVTGR